MLTFIKAMQLLIEKLIQIQNQFLLQFNGTVSLQRKLFLVYSHFRHLNWRGYFP